jgi:hypothetical protein
LKLKLFLLLSITILSANIPTHIQTLSTNNYSYFEKKLILSKTYQNEPTNSDAKTSTGSTSKVNSSNVNFATDIGYSSEKTVATIGQGTLTIKDTEGSDELDRLNRDIDQPYKKLYEGRAKQGTFSIKNNKLSAEAEKRKKEIDKENHVELKELW